MAGASSDISELRDDQVVVFRLFPNPGVVTLFFRNHFLFFPLPIFSQSAIQNRGAYYTWAHIIHG